ATIAINFPQDMQRLSFTSFGHPDEWKTEGVAQPSFFGDWTQNYQKPDRTIIAPAPGIDAILTYDAFKVIVQAISSVHGQVTGATIRTALASLGTGNVPAYQGISGKIYFDSKGNPVSKAVVVLTVRPDASGTNQITLLQVAGVFK
ncbi:MAG: hypothetical protein M3Z24_13295, partial [Chloroflexota bacterium]|nr:hypothetical protein [Chloroflexota bacterium]